MVDAILAIDIGGSAVKSAIVSRRNNYWNVIRRWAPEEVRPRSFAVLEEIVMRSVARGLAEGHVGDLAISTTGSVSPAGIVLRSGVFADYKEVSWDSLVRSRFGSRVHDVAVVNDGQAATWGTFVADPVAIGKQLLHIVVGTGVGGGLTVGGHLVRGAHGLAGGIGHVKVSDGTGVLCHCGREGCVEPRASAAAVVRYASLMIAGHADEMLSQESVATLSQLSRAAQMGSTIARSAFEEAGQWLGKAISCVASVIDPEIVTIGGGVVDAASSARSTNDNPYVLGARTSARAWARTLMRDTLDVQRASLGNDAALIGAAALIAEVIERRG